MACMRMRDIGCIIVVPLYVIRLTYQAIISACSLNGTEVEPAKDSHGRPMEHGIPLPAWRRERTRELNDQLVIDPK